MRIETGGIGAEAKVAAVTGGGGREESTGGVAFRTSFDARGFDSKSVTLVEQCTRVMVSKRDSRYDGETHKTPSRIGCHEVSLISVECVLDQVAMKQRALRSLQFWIAEAVEF